jgi:putative ABC transport system permease protein
MLTTLGVVIGVGSVIAMMSVGAGARERMAAQLEQLGPNNLIVRAGSTWRSGIRAWGTATRLELADAVAIRELPGIIEVVPQVDNDVQARYRGTNWATRIRGVTPHNLWPVTEGEFFSEWHLDNAANVCVLGQSVVRELFGLANPIGENIIIKRLPCRVIGVLSAKGASAYGTDQDDVILAPLTTVQRKIRGKTHLNRIVVITGGREAALDATQHIRRVMRKRHRLASDQDDDFRIYNRAELAETSEESAQVFTWLLGSIASVSLLVGGIGIMNMMLVSVTGRTREIGIRMALGARRRDILLQFLFEAIMLSGIGGLLGVGVGLLAALLLGRFTGLPVSVTAWSIGIAFLFSVLVGVFFGLHPARKAAYFQPVDALRFE